MAHKQYTITDWVKKNKLTPEEMISIQLQRAKGKMDYIIESAPFVITKELELDRRNPLIRLPAKMFKNIDKRKNKIPVLLGYCEQSGTVTISVDWNKYNMIIFKNQKLGKAFSEKHFDPKFVKGK